MIDIRKLKELVRLMVDNDLSEIDLQDQQETVTIKRGSQVVMGAPVVHHAPANAAIGHAGSASGASRSSSGSDGDSAAAAVDMNGLVAINSPMVGTVYLAPNPESPAFVQVGASVGVDSTVCMIEAMKVFSEIKAESGGTIERILVSNAQSVEYGQPLFLVRPN